MKRAFPRLPAWQFNRVGDYPTDPESAFSRSTSRHVDPGHKVSGPTTL